MSSRHSHTLTDLVSLVRSLSTSELVPYAVSQADAEAAALAAVNGEFVQAELDNVERLRGLLAG